MHIFMLKSTPMTSKNRSRSSIFELNQDTPEIHPWYKFGANVTNICWVIVFTSEKVQVFMLKSTPWPRKIGQGHPSSNLTKPLVRYIHGIKLVPMRLIFVELSCLQAKKCKFSCWNRPPWPRKISQGHPSSNLTKTLVRYIHGISLVPMRLIFVELSCLQAKKCKFSCWNRPPWPRKISQGHPSSNLTLLSYHVYKQQEASRPDSSAV